VQNSPLPSRAEGAKIGGVNYTWLVQAELHSESQRVITEADASHCRSRTLCQVPRPAKGTPYSLPLTKHSSFSAGERARVTSRTLARSLTPKFGDEKATGAAADLPILAQGEPPRATQGKRL